MSNGRSDTQYEVLSPWAEADLIPVKGISPRVTDLSGKKIGLFRNFKRAAKPVMMVVERELKKMFPTAEFSWFDSTSANVLETETENKEKFTKWIEEVDTAILGVGD